MAGLPQPPTVTDFPWKGYDPTKTPRLFLTLDAFLTRKGIRFSSPPRLNQATGGKHAATSLHYYGRARDYGHSDSDLLAIAAALQPYAQGVKPRLVELFWSEKDIFWKRGAQFDPSRDLFQMHLDHLHASLAVGATFDDL